MEQITITRRLPVKYRAEVCVVGAGPAGIAAAVTSARRGAKTVLLESSALPGGLSTAGLIPLFMPVSDGIHFLPGGFGKELLTRLRMQSAARGFASGNAINAEHLKRVYEEMLTESGVEILYQTRLTDAVTEEGTVRAVLCNSPGGNFAVQSPVYVDATGDGALAVLAGAPFELGDGSRELMPVTLCSLWAGFDWERYVAGKAFSHNDDNMLEKLTDAFASGLLPEEDYHHTGLIRISRIAAAGNIGHVFGVDPTDERSITRGLLAGRRLLARYEEFYRTAIDGFAAAEIVASASFLGVRESRRIIADYTLTREDYDARRSFPDEIGRYHFPADIHPSRPGKAELLAHKKLFSGSGYARGESYGIPFRSLVPRNVANLLCAGRCVGCDRHVMASLRVIPGCFITGQAAGMAAALSPVPRELDPERLRGELRDIGAFPALIKSREKS